MKSVIALLALVLIAGCSGSNSSGGGDTPPNKNNGGPTTGGVGQSKVAATFLTNAWCNTYAIQNRENQDRVTFEKDGVATFTQFELKNGQRVSQLGKTVEGTWGTDGKNSQIAVGSFVFQISFNENDQNTNVDRVYLKIDSKWVPFDICD